MQLREEIKNCNGCSACVVACKDHCVKMIEDKNGYKYPELNEGGCNRCNNCKLHCPIFWPVKMPTFEKFYEYSDDYYHRNMPEVYRETMRKIRSGQATEFAGTLCQIAGLISLLGDKIPERVEFYPLHCDISKPRRPECAQCRFYKQNG